MYIHIYIYINSTLKESNETTNPTPWPGGTSRIHLWFLHIFHGSSGRR